MRLSILKAARPMQQAYVPPAALDGEPDPRYPRNNRNQPEFGSVLLTLDHLVAADDLHVHQKAVYSTQTAAEALMSLMNEYYPSLGAPKPNLDAATFEILKQLDEDPVNSIALWFVPVVVDRRGGMIVQVVLSNAALQRLVTHPAFGNGSALLAMNALVDAVSSLALKTAQQVGQLPPLLLMQLQDQASDRQEPQRAEVKAA